VVVAVQTQVICDGCGRKEIHPRDWWTLTPLSVSPGPGVQVITLEYREPVPPKHFCSTHCLSRWSQGLME
jgi:hypothetical protein